jgi:hypothetical protein
MTRELLISSILLLSVRGQDSAETQRMQAKLEHAREVNLERAAKLPSFVADETAKRYKSKHIDPPNWQYVDTIESEIAVRGATRFSRAHTRLNGKPWNKPSFPNFTWGVLFGSELRAVFSPECRATIESEGRQEARGKQLLAYKFHAPPEGCFGLAAVRNGFFSSTKRYNPARSGRFLIDDPGGNVIQFQVEASEFPKGFGMDPIKQTMSWDYVKIGDGSWLLPVAADIFGGFFAGDLWHVTVEYKNHRHFEASTNLVFGPDDAHPK